MQPRARSTRSQSRRTAASGCLRRVGGDAALCGTAMSNSAAIDEIINIERTVTYARNDGSPWLLDPVKSKHLHNVLSEAHYRSPLQDGDAPWVDPDDHDTYNFYGIYPLGIEGIDDSTRTSVITENIGDGGNAGRVRHGTRQMVFNCLLLGQDDAAVNAGMAWLRSALLTSGCEGSRGCEGTDLC